MKLPAVSYRTAIIGRRLCPSPGRLEGSVPTIAFELDGQAFTALNGSPHFKFNETIFAGPFFFGPFSAR